VFLNIYETYYHRDQKKSELEARGRHKKIMKKNKEKGQKRALL